MLDQAHAAQPGYRERYLGEEHPDQISIQCKTSVRQEAGYFPIGLGERKIITFEYKQKSMKGKKIKSEVVLVVITPS